jgi:hypothetical protein
MDIDYNLLKDWEFDRPVEAKAKVGEGLLKI